MTPQQKIKRTILEKITKETFDDEDIDYIIDDNDGDYHDALSEFRQGEVETNIPCDWSRNYESKSVAAQMYNGSWVGWTYWYGGGKHGCPEQIDWLKDAYDLEIVKEEQKIITIRTWKVKENV